MEYSEYVLFFKVHLKPALHLLSSSWDIQTEGVFGDRNT